MKDFIGYLERRIEGCDNLGGMEREKAVYQSILKEYRRQCNITDVSFSLPNEIDLGALANLLIYSDKYEISIQFWPEQTAVFIEKDGVDLKDYGGGFGFAVSKSIAYLNRITGNES